MGKGVGGADLLFSARTSSMRRQYWVLGSSPLIPSLGLGNIRLEQRIILIDNNQEIYTRKYTRFDAFTCSNNNYLHFFS
jgi:hypothetical protein